MILADSSAWVEYDRATGSAAHLRLRDLIGDQTSRSLAVTEPVIMEVAAGARTDDREVALRRLLQRFELLAFDPVADFDGAVALYRGCRQVGITPRGLLDCMIASVASRHGAALLAHDGDLSRVARVADIAMDPASLMV